MKNIFKSIILAAAVVASAGQVANAATYPVTTTTTPDNNFYQDGLRYIIYRDSIQNSSKKGDYSISYRAALTNQLTTVNNYCHVSGEVNIPEYLDFQDIKVPVTIINGSALSNNTTITKVTVPSTIKTLNAAFNDMTALEEVIFAESEFTSIPAGIFSGCTSLKRVVFPSNPTSWTTTNAFKNCAALKSVTFPADSKLETVSGGASGTGAFYGCSSLRSFAFPASTWKFTAAYMFENCGVETVIFNDNANYTGRDLVNTEANRLYFSTYPAYLFKDCPNLKTVVFPTYIRYMVSKTTNTNGIYMFNNCPALSNVVFPENCTLPGIPAYFINNCGITTFNAPKSATWIGQYAFNNNANLKKINIQEGVTSIGTYAFANCPSLTSINIPEGVTTMGNYALAYCSSLTKIVLPSTLATVPQYCFRENTSLTDVTITPGPTQVAAGAFYGCTALKSIVIPEGVASFGGSNHIFFNCSALEYVVLPSTFHGNGYILSDGMTSLKAIVSRSTAPVTTYAKEVDDLLNTVTIYVPTEELIATYKTKTGWSKFTNYAVSGLFSMPETATLYLGEKLALNTTTENKVDPLVEALGIIWNSSDPATVSIDADGRLVANQITTSPVTVTGAYWGNALTCDVTVIENPFLLTLYDMTLLDGESKAINANLALNQHAPSGITLPVNPSINWTVADPEIAEVAENGVIKALKLGQTTLTAEYRGATRTVNVYVQPVGNFSISLGDLAVKKGENIQLTPMLETEDELIKVDPAAIKWDVAVNGDINAFVDGSGKLYGAQIGETTITANYYGKTATAKVVVTEGAIAEPRRYTLVFNMPDAKGQVHILNATDGTVVHFEPHGDGHINAVHHDDNEITHTLDNGRYTVNNPDKDSTTVVVKYDR